MGYSPVICSELILYYRFSNHNKTLVETIPSGHIHAFNIIYENIMDTINNCSYMLVAQSIRPSAWLSLLNMS